MMIPLSIALHMSYTVRAAIATAVKASISTPVLEVVLARLWILIELVPGSSLNSTCIWLRGSGWQSGIKLDVCLPPIIPAIWETVKTSPFFSLFSRTALKASSLRTTEPTAIASLVVTFFSLTSTIFTFPSTSTWVRPLDTGGEGPSRSWHLLQNILFWSERQLKIILSDIDILFLLKLLPISLWIWGQIVPGWKLACVPISSIKMTCSFSAE